MNKEELKIGDSQIIIYQTPDGNTQLDVTLEKETVWLTQAQIADLFGTKRPATTKHLNNIYKSNELDENSICSILEHMGNDGKQQYQANYNNAMEAIDTLRYKSGSSRLFGNEKDQSFKSSINTIYQTFGGEDLLSECRGKSSKIIIFSC